MSNQPTKSKDPLITFKSVKPTVSKKGATGYQLSMSQEQAQLLLDCIQANLANPRGVKFSFYTTKKQTEDGREFDSGFAFVSAIQEFGSQRPATTGRFVPKVASAETEAKVKKYKTEL